MDQTTHPRVLGANRTPHCYLYGPAPPFGRFTMPVSVFTGGLGMPFIRLLSQHIGSRVVVFVLIYPLGDAQEVSSDSETAFLGGVDPGPRLSWIKPPSESRAIF